MSSDPIKITLPTRTVMTSSLSNINCGRVRHINTIIRMLLEHSSSTVTAAQLAALVHAVLTDVASSAANDQRERIKELSTSIIPAMVSPNDRRIADEALRLLDRG